MSGVAALRSHLLTACAVSPRCWAIASWVDAFSQPELSDFGSDFHLFTPRILELQRCYPYNTAINNGFQWI